MRHSGTHAIIRYFTPAVIACVILVAFSLVIGLPRYRLGFDPGDEGFLAYGAERVMQGQIPNRDFASFQPPLAFYTVAAVFKIFGTSLVSLRTLGLIIYVLIPILIYLISLKLTNYLVAFAVAIPSAIIGMPFFNFAPFAVWHGILTSLITVLLIITAVQRQQYRWAFLAGLTTALTLLSRHDQGFYLFISIFIYACAIKFANRNTSQKLLVGRIVGAWISGITVLILPLCFYWLINGVIPYMFKQMVVFLLTKYAETSSLPMPTFRPGDTLVQTIEVSLYYLPLLAYLVALLWIVKNIVCRQFHTRHANTLFILVLSMLFYCQVLTRSDIHHLLVTLAPLFILCSCLIPVISTPIGNIIGKILNKNKQNWPAKRIGTAATLLIFAVIATTVLTYSTHPFLQSTKMPTKIISLERAGLRTDPISAEGIKNITELIQKHANPNRSIICLPYHSMFYFLSSRRNPTRWNYLWPGDTTEQENLDFIDQMKKDPPAAIAIFGESKMQSVPPLIADYIEKEYRLVYDYSSFAFYLPPKQDNQEHKKQK